MFANAIDQAKDYQSFLENSPSAFHAADQVGQRLREYGYKQLESGQVWPKQPGKFFFVTAGAVVAWHVPEGLDPNAFTYAAVGAHTDSPAFKLKPAPAATKTPDGWNQLEVEVYGGMLANSWLDRDLGLAGRVITEDGNTHLVKTGAIARIPQLAIHLDRDIDREGLKLDPQQHLHPIWGFGHDLDIYRYLADQAKVPDFCGADIFTYDTQGPALIGPQQDFVAAARQDNLSSVHAALVAFQETSERHVAVFAAFDHEEVGSGSATGARGPLLEQVLRHCARSVGADSSQYEAALRRSVLISADAGHLVHPNYADRHDPHHHPVPGAGPLLKVNADQRYATSDASSAFWEVLCRRAQVPYQHFVSNNSMPCGSTIGPFNAMRLGILTVDVGIGLLSMHSVRELSHIADSFQLSQALAKFWNE